METIKIKFKNGRVTAVGNASDEHIWLACQKLNLNEVEPTRFKKLKRFIKKFIRCAKYALSSDTIPERREKNFCK